MRVIDIIRAEMLKGAKVKADRKAAEALGITEEQAAEAGIEFTDDMFEPVTNPDEQNIVVCVPSHWPTPFTDNETGHCIECGRSIVFRPGYDPKMVKVCTPCVMGFDMHADLLKKETE